MPLCRVDHQPRLNTQLGQTLNYTRNTQALQAFSGLDWEQTRAKAAKTTLRAAITSIKSAGRSVDVVTEKGLHWYIKERILSEAKPI